MSLYLCISRNNETKSYEAKSSAQKPYLRVSTGYFPLTTKTSPNWGLRVRKDNKTYRIVESYTTTSQGISIINTTTSVDSSNTYYEYETKTTTCNTEIQILNAKPFAGQYDAFTQMNDALNGCTYKTRNWAGDPVYTVSTAKGSYITGDSMTRSTETMRYAGPSRTRNMREVSSRSLYIGEIAECNSLASFYFTISGYTSRNSAGQITTRSQSEVRYNGYFRAYGATTRNYYITRRLNPNDYNEVTAETMQAETYIFGDLCVSYTSNVSNTTSYTKSGLIGAAISNIIKSIAQSYGYNYATVTYTSDSNLTARWTQPTKIDKFFINNTITKNPFNVIKRSVYSSVNDWVSTATESRTTIQNLSYCKIDDLGYNGYYNVISIYSTIKSTSISTNQNNKTQRTSYFTVQSNTTQNTTFEDTITLDG